jgi:hypothetical protein
LTTQLDLGLNPTLVERRQMFYTLANFTIRLLPERGYLPSGAPF